MSARPEKSLPPSTPKSRLRHSLPHPRRSSYERRPSQRNQRKGSPAGRRNWPRPGNRFATAKPPTNPFAPSSNGEISMRTDKKGRPKAAPVEHLEGLLDEPE